MLWKNLVVLAGLVWFANAQAAQPVVEESIDDALAQKYEAPTAQKEQQRGVAQQGKTPASEKEPDEGTEVKYWRWSEAPDRPRD
jgi:hypothetical protein